jgi:hypothetical protein
MFPPMIPLGIGQIPPLHQREAISWLQQFKNTELLQQMLRRFDFSETEVVAYRSRCAVWLKPKKVFSIQQRGNG